MLLGDPQPTSVAPATMWVGMRDQDRRQISTRARVHQRRPLASYTNDSVSPSEAIYLRERFFFRREHAAAVGGDAGRASRPGRSMSYIACAVATMGR